MKSSELLTSLPNSKFEISTTVTHHQYPTVFIDRHQASCNKCRARIFNSFYCEMCDFDICLECFYDLKNASSRKDTLLHASHLLYYYSDKDNQNILVSSLNFPVVLNEVITSYIIPNIDPSLQKQLELLIDHCFLTNIVYSALEVNRGGLSNPFLSSNYPVSLFYTTAREIVSTEFLPEEKMNVQQVCKVATFDSFWDSYEPLHHDIGYMTISIQYDGLPSHPI